MKKTRENTVLALLLILMILGYNSTFAMNTFIGFSKENLLLDKTELSIAGNSEFTSYIEKKEVISVNLSKVTYIHMKEVKTISTHISQSSTTIEPILSIEISLKNIINKYH